MRKIPLTKGKYAIVDDDDYDFLSIHKWCTNNGYASTTISGRVMFMHRHLLSIGKGEMGDHINRNKLDNRRANLRVCSVTGNNRNRGIQKNNKSGYKGVVYVKNPRSLKKWKAILRTNGRSLSLGYFNSKVSAAKCYDENAIKMFGEFACGNFSMV